MQRRFKITVDGRDYDVKVTEVIEGPGNLYPDRGTMEAAQTAADKAPASAATAPTSAATDAAPAPAGAAPGRAAGPGDVVSSIGGVVVSIDVALGARVEVSTRVATLEAMKTKTYVNAGRSGTVSDIAVRKGDPVEVGQVLLTIA